MACQAKHTKFQPPDSEWKCPDCGAEIGDFYVDESEGDEDCTLLHPGDYLFCSKCKNDTSGQAFSNLIKKKLNMVPCPHCKGSGFVPKKE